MQYKGREKAAKVVEFVAKRIYEFLNFLWIEFMSVYGTEWEMIGTELRRDI